MAATTTWHPRTNFTPKTWLLTDGSTVQDPPLEETASGRKVRIAGTDLSMFSKDVDELIFQGVQQVASSKGLKPWMLLNDKEIQEGYQQHFGQRLFKKAHLHLLDQAGRGYGFDHSTIWFRFKHPTLPIEAVLVVELGQQRYGGRNNGDFQVNVSVLMPSTVPNDANKVVVINETNNEFISLRSRLPGHAERDALAQFIRTNKPDWQNSLDLQEHAARGNRQAVKMFRNLVREAEGLSEISIPDLRDYANPAWLTLEFVDTNVSGEFMASLADFLDGSGVVQEIKAHYDEIRRLFRATGVHLADASEHDWARALAGGEPVTVQIESSPNEEKNEADGNHSVTLHIPTGTVIVNCAARQARRDEVAHKWDEALTMASLTGQEDVLLAYARRYAETEQSRRRDKILEERTLDDD